MDGSDGFHIDDGRLVHGDNLKVRRVASCFDLQTAVVMKKRDGWDESLLCRQMFRRHELLALSSKHRGDTSSARVRAQVGNACCWAKADSICGREVYLVPTARQREESMLRLQTCSESPKFGGSNLASDCFCVRYRKLHTNDGWAKLSRGLPS